MVFYLSTWLCEECDFLPLRAVLWRSILEVQMRSVLWRSNLEVLAFVILLFSSLSGYPTLMIKQADITFSEKLHGQILDCEFLVLRNYLQYASIKIYLHLGKSWSKVVGLATFEMQLVTCLSEVVYPCPWLTLLPKDDRIWKPPLENLNIRVFWFYIIFNEKERETVVGTFWWKWKREKKDKYTHSLWIFVATRFLCEIVGVVHFKELQEHVAQHSIFVCLLPLRTRLLTRIELVFGFLVAVVIGEFLNSE